MAKRWINGGVWVVLLASVMLAWSRTARAEKPATPGKFIIRDVIIHGNKRMTSEQIKKRLHTRIGQEYIAAVVDEDVRELYKTNQFSNIATYQEASGPNRVKVYFAVREMPNLVQKVTFQGAKHIKEEELHNITGLHVGMTLNPRLNQYASEVILKKYDEMGRSFASCTLVKGENLADTEVDYQITEGPKVIVRDIQFTGNTFVSSTRLAQQLKSSGKWLGMIGGIYNKQMADADINTLYEYFRSFGYLDVRVSLETQRADDGRELTLIFHIQEGQRYKIPDALDQITKTIPAEQLQAQSRIKPGDYRNDRDIPKLMTNWIGYHGEKATVVSIPQNKTDSRTPARVSQIHIIGNKCISDESILAHVPLFPGQVLSDADLQQAEKNLAKLGVFVVDAATGERPTITVAEGDGVFKDLFITVREKSNSKSAKPQ